MVVPLIIQDLAEHEDAASDAGRVSDAQPEARKRYNIIPRIRHPHLDSAEITATLGWEPHVAWKPGDPAITPKDTKLPGIRRDGLWSRSFYYKGPPWQMSKVFADLKIAFEFETFPKWNRTQPRGSCIRCLSARYHGEPLDLRSIL